MVCVLNLHSSLAAHLFPSLSFPACGSLSINGHDPPRRTGARECSVEVMGEIGPSIMEAKKKKRGRKKSKNNKSEWVMLPKIEAADEEECELILIPN